MDTPFIYNTYVTGKNFIGRKTECNTLSNLLGRKENVAIYEPPKSGKRSLIQQTLFNMRISGKQFSACQVNLFNIRSIGMFLTRFGSAVVRSCFSTPSEYEDAVGRLLEGTHFVFDKDRFARIDEVVSLNWEYDADDIYAVLSLPYRISAERDIKALEEGKPHKADKDYVPGSIIQGSLRDGAYYPTKSEGGTLVRLAKYAMYIVLGIFLYVFAKYFAYMFL